MVVGAGVVTHISDNPDLQPSSWWRAADYDRGMGIPPIAPAPPPPGERTFPLPSNEESPNRLAPAVTPPVASSQYAVRQTQDDGATPVTWSPCRSIRYVVNPGGAPEGFVEELRLVLAEVSAATGLTFVDEGLTDEVPSASRAAFLPQRYGDRWAPVLISFASPDTVADFAAHAGLANASVARDPQTGSMHWVSGWAYLNANLTTWALADGSAAYLPVLRHELGHLVGLDHLNDPTQIMYAASNDITHFQTGDLAGLAALGGGPCAPNL